MLIDHLMAASTKLSELETIFFEACNLVVVESVSPKDLSSASLLFIQFMVIPSKFEVVIV